MNKDKENYVAHQLFKEEFNWEAHEGKLLFQYKAILKSWKMYK